MNTNRKPLYGDKALEIFFGDNPSPIATAMWATAMRNNYEAEIDKLLESKVPADVRETYEAMDSKKRECARVALEAIDKVLLVSVSGVDPELQVRGLRLALESLRISFLIIRDL